MAIWYTQKKKHDHEKVFWKNAVNLQENTYAEVWFQQIYFASLLKSHFMGFLL